MTSLGQLSRHLNLGRMCYGWCWRLIHSDAASTTIIEKIRGLKMPQEMKENSYLISVMTISEQLLTFRSDYGEGSREDPL